MTKDALGYYRILNVSPEASGEEIKRQYRDLAKVWHPDHNKAENALEVFQKLSSAYEVLQDETARLVYDILSQVYDEKTFPDLENIQPIKSGTEGIDLRVLTPTNVRGQIWKTLVSHPRIVCGYRDALRQTFKISAGNWLLGWWSAGGLLKTPRALIQNFKEVDNKTANLQLLSHNAVAYWHEKDVLSAAASAVRALDYADAGQKACLQKFIALLNQRIPRPKAWNFAALRLVQLIIPGILLLLPLFSGGAVYLTESELWDYFSKKDEISYYQEVNFGKRGRSVDDVVVGKILNIPVDRADSSRLYHLRQKVKIMYGPSDDFDVMKELPARTTVRLTGLSPDNIWARVMIDNGEMGFVRQEMLQQGIGLPIPEFSQIVNN